MKDICDGGTFSTNAELQAPQYCAVINGDLTIRLSPNGPAVIELPNTVEVLGNLLISSSELIPSARTVTFANLSRVGGSLQLGAVDSVSAGRLSIYTEYRFPKLTRIDTALAAVLAKALRSLDLSSLLSVGESISLEYLDQLNDLQLGSLTEVGGDITVLLLPNHPYRPVFARLADPTIVSVGGRTGGFAAVGCCIEDNQSSDCASRAAPTGCL